jgi:subtilase family serine protease
LTATRQLPALAPGATSAGIATISIPTRLALGTYYLVACADDFLKVIEADESNNCAVAAAQVTVQRPDLVATAVSDPPAVVQPAGSLAVTDTVVNQSLVTSGASGTRYYLSPGPVKTTQSRLLTGTRNVPMLAPGATSHAAKTVTVATSTPLGTYYLHACADDLKQVVESDETNNCVVAATQVTVGRPDLLVTAVSNPPATAPRGSTFGVTETVMNQGAVDSPSSTTRFWLSFDTNKGSGDVLLAATRTVPLLPAGHSNTAPSPTTVTVPAGMATGSYYVLACAEDRAIIVEANELNNCRASSTKVTVQ